MIPHIKRHPYLLFILMLFGVLLYPPHGIHASKNTKTVPFIELADDTINPITAEYIADAIELAERNEAPCLVVKLDTPGGLLSSTRSIVKSIMASQIPVVVYISPSGSRAGSAGVFITYASHVAAMAPSTNIGAAHPVQMGGEKGKEKKDFWDSFKELTSRDKDSGEEEANEQEAKKQDNKKRSEKKKDRKKKAQEQESEEEEISADEDAMSSKILQDTVAFIRSLARRRDRNVEWAVQSVTKSASITETEALELKVIEIIAKSDEDLLSQLDGRVVNVQGEEVTLKTKESTIQRIAMDARQKFFNVLANPNIAYILMILGFYGLLYEVTHPGIGVPGIMGAIFLILAFFSMQTLPTNYAGIALILLGLSLFIAEAFAPGLGLLTLGGIVCMVLGSLMLFDPQEPSIRVSLGLIAGFTGISALFSILVLRSVILAHKQKVTTGQEGLIGETGTVQVNIKQGRTGKVFVHGELWNASSDTPINKGEKIEVVSIDGMILTVKKI